MSEISGTEIKSMTKEQNYMRGYRDGKSDVLDKIRAEIEALEYLNIEDGSDGYDKYIEQYEVLKIIDKYKSESEG
jgi:phosphoenolpyruvate synthase/pyruvate phosphate dikinase